MKKKLQKFLPKLIGAKLNALYRIKPKKAVQQSFQLFCTPRKGKILPGQVPFLDKAKAGKITCSGKTLQTYHWPNSGKRIILVHGWESNTSRWQVLIEKLQQEKFDIYAFDAPAHGYSDGKTFDVITYSECLEAMIQQHTPDYLIGHSIGAMTTVFNQYKNPNSLIKGTVLMGAPSELNFFITNFQHLLNLKPQLMSDLDFYFKEKLGYHFREFSTAGFAKTIDSKCLIIHDHYDKIVHFEAAEAIHQNWSNSTLISTEGIGHSLFNSAVDDRIIEFIKA